MILKIDSERMSAIRHKAIKVAGFFSVLKDLDKRQEAYELIGLIDEAIDTAGEEKNDTNKNT